MKTFIINYSILLAALGLVGLISVNSVQNTLDISVPLVATENIVSYSNDVVPIIEAKCNVAACHDGSQPPNLENYKKVRVWLGRISFRINYEKDPMPPKDAETQLTEEELALLNAWIKQGAKNN